MRLIDPTERTELTGPWAGFGFQQGHLCLQGVDMPSERSPRVSIIRDSLPASQSFARIPNGLIPFDDLALIHHNDPVSHAYGR